MNLNNLYLKTAFSCMACDGNIDKQEIILLKKLHEEKHFFGEINLNQVLDELLLEINKDSRTFFRNYFNELASCELSEQDELRLIEIAIDTIRADSKIEYSEIKFFKVIRSKLRIDNESILKIHPDIEDFLEQDIISESYLLKLQDDYLEKQILPQFEQIDFALKDVDFIQRDE